MTDWCAVSSCPTPAKVYASALLSCHGSFFACRVPYVMDLSLHVMSLMSWIFPQWYRIILPSLYALLLLGNTVHQGLAMKLLSHHFLPMKSTHSGVTRKGGWLLIIQSLVGRTIERASTIL